MFVVVVVKSSAFSVTVLPLVENKPWSAAEKNDGDRMTFGSGIVKAATWMLPTRSRTHMPSDWRRLDLVVVSIIAAMDQAPLSSIPSTPTEVVARGWKMEDGGQRSERQCV